MDEYDEYGNPKKFSKHEEKDEYGNVKGKFIQGGTFGQEKLKSILRGRLPTWLPCTCSIYLQQTKASFRDKKMCRPAYESIDVSLK